MNWYKSLLKSAAVEDGPRATVIHNIDELKMLLSKLKGDSFVRNHILHDGLRKMFMRIDGTLLNIQECVKMRSDFTSAIERLGQSTLTLNAICEELNGLARSANYNFDYLKHPAVLQYDRLEQKIYSDLTRLGQMNPPRKPQVQPPATPVQQAVPSVQPYQQRASTG